MNPARTKLFLYVASPILVSWLTETETWSGETWQQTHWFLIIRSFIAALVPGLIAWKAYLDPSYAKAKEEQKTKEAALAAPTV